MKKIILIGSLLNILFYKGQVGINTSDPKTTLHIVAKSTGSGTAEGLIAPNLTRAQIISKDNLYDVSQKGAIVYVSEIDASDVITSKTVQIISKGYYYFDGLIWRRLSYNTEQIYLPSFNLPLPSVSETTLTFDLYTDVYKKQYTKAGNTSFVSSNPDLIQIPDLYTADQLDYVVSYYDSTVIKDVGINSNGVMSYKVVSTNPPNSSFINIVLVVK